MSEEIKTIKVQSIACTHKEPHGAHSMPGEIVELDEETAVRWIKEGWAIAIPLKKETAVKK